ncbi:hypothetical protein [Heyndrickxia vini]|uniref:Tim44-like domain-containing protein n=1 Tax=Heyndrickxia vini TaxID=1476025 RepID=A0ABX7E505_9BACI|nr:hypothetical protein [Heyndrickxia vini]QQZ10824.1 hypothetical protein I5776_07985 [Heyndrickxia vini]
MELIIAIVVGIIGFIVKRKTEGQEAEKKSASRPVFSPAKPSVTTQQKVKKVVSTIETSYKNEKAPLLEKMEKNIERTNEAQIIKKYEEVTSFQKDYHEETKKIDIDESDLLKGIILAEVLGPPRAKKPFKSK